MYCSIDFSTIELHNTACILRKIMVANAIVRNHHGLYIISTLLYNNKTIVLLFQVKHTFYITFTRSSTIKFIAFIFCFITAVLLLLVTAAFTGTHNGEIRWTLCSSLFHATSPCQFTFFYVTFRSVATLKYIIRVVR